MWSVYIKKALNSLAELSEKFNQFFSPEAIEEIAKSSEFKIRKSELTPEAFVKVLLFNSTSLRELTLDNIVTNLEKHFGCSITKQGLDERFTANSVKFINELNNKALNIFSNNLVSDQNLLEHFSDVSCKDSTNVQLPKQLSSDYGGSGGAASGALARVQFEYGIKNMNIQQIELTKGKKQDVTYAVENLDKLTENVLYIRDLGYVSVQYMMGVIEHKAFFLNKVKPNQTLYTRSSQGHYMELSFKNLGKQFTNKAPGFQDIEVFIKLNNDYIPLRLLAEKVPEHVYKQRIKAYKKKNRTKKEPRENYKYRSRFNLLITNASKEKLDKKAVGALYSMRWQVELIFKAWKSILKLDEIKKMKKERLETHLLLKLLLIIITWEPYMLANHFVKSENKKVFHAVSYYKFIKNVANSLYEFLLAAKALDEQLKKHLKNLFDFGISKKCYVEIKNKSRAKDMMTIINDLIVDIQ